MSVCVSAHKHMEDFVHGGKEVKPAAIQHLCWRGLPLCPSLRGIPKLGGLLPQLKLDSEVRNSNKKEIYLSVC